MAKNTKSRKKSSSNIFDIIRKEAGLKAFGIKQARAGLNKLVKQGVLSSRTNTEQPSKYALSKLRKFYSVIQGKAAAVQINPGEKKAYREAGYTVQGSAAIIPRKKGQTIKRVPQKNGAPAFQIQTRDKYGQVRMEATNVLHPTYRLDEYLERLRAQGMTIKKGEYVGFRFYGFNSHGLYASLDSAINFFEQYKTVAATIREGSEEEQMDMIQNLQFVTVKPGKQQKEWEHTASTQTMSDRQYEDRFGRQRGSTYNAERKRANNRKLQSSRREQMTPEERKIYNEKGRARAAASRARKAGK